MVLSCTLVLLPGLVLGDSIGNVGYMGYNPAGNTGKCREQILSSLHLGHAQTFQVIYLQLTCDWMYKLLATACNKRFNMLNILLAIL